MIDIAILLTPNLDFIIFSFVGNMFQYLCYLSKTKYSTDPCVHDFPCNQLPMTYNGCKF